MGFTRPCSSRLGWKQGQEEIILDYMAAGEESSLDSPPAAQPWLGILAEGSRGGTGAARGGEAVGVGVGAQVTAPHAG